MNQLPLISRMSLKVIVSFTWITALMIPCSVQATLQKNDRVISIDHTGLGSIECCVYGNCRCSDLSFALEHVQENTEIKIQSDIYLFNTVLFGNVSSVKIAGLSDSNPTVRCKHQGGLVGKNINYIVIQDVTWDSCNGIDIDGFLYAYITNCNFKYSIEFTLKLNGYLDSSLLIKRSIFSYNSGGISASASSILVNECDFVNNAQHPAVLSMHHNDLRVNTKVIINGSNFVGNSGQALLCLQTNFVQINSSCFINNTCSAVTLYNSNLVSLNSVTFYNNSANATQAVPLSGRSKGAGIQLYNSTLNITESVFLNNLASENGGAIYAGKGSNIYIYQTTAKFINNIAKNGGAIYISNDSTFHAYKSYVKFINNFADNGGAIYIDQDLDGYINETVTNLEFINNTATLYGGGLYVNRSSNDNHNLYYYYRLLLNAKYFSGNVAYKKGNYCYFNADDTSNLVCDLELLKEHNNSFVSSHCNSEVITAAVRVNESDYDNECGSVLFWIQDFNFNAAFEDHFGDSVEMINVTVRINQNCSNFAGRECCEGYNGTFNYIIDTISNKTVSISNNTVTCGCLGDDTPTNSSTIHIPFHPSVNKLLTSTSQNCSDMMHYYNHSNVCENLSCAHLSKHFTYLLPGIECPLGRLTVTPGYWYDNGFKLYVFSCIHFCNFNNWYDKILPQSHPDRDLQCNENWKGFACGECDYDSNYSIKFDTLKCVPVNECLTTSVIYSILIIFGVSFFYWVIVISFVFVLLHFKFEITAGSAYGIIFYYSILEQIFDVFNGVIRTRYCGIPGDESIYYDCLLGPVDFLEVLPFLLTIGNLKPPFMQYMNLCLGSVEMIDHLFLQYIHPMIVVIIVTVIYQSARNSVRVSSIIWRYINSKSICLFLLLSYSSISYVSLQLLIPLPYFKPDKDDTTIPYGTVVGWKTYWSPHVQYFHRHHVFYFIVAILCELIIGIGLPVILLTHRRLCQNFNTSLWGIKHIVDELQGCYKKEYSSFAAYYLICRQLIYAVNILLHSLLWMFSIEPGLVEVITMLTVCSFILVVHLWFQPYNKDGLNILDAAILSTLILQLICSLDGRSYGIVIIFWILPLLFFINYLTYYTKFKHYMTLCSICAIIIAVSLLVFLQKIPDSGSFYYLGVASLLFLLFCFCLFVSYILVVLTNLIKWPCNQVEEHHVQLSVKELSSDGGHPIDDDDKSDDDNKSDDDE